MWHSTERTYNLKKVLYICLVYKCIFKMLCVCVCMQAPLPPSLTHLHVYLKRYCRNPWRLALPVSFFFPTLFQYQLIIAHESFMLLFPLICNMWILQWLFLLLLITTFLSHVDRKYFICIFTMLIFLLMGMLQTELFCNL